MTRHYLIWANDTPHFSESLETALYLAVNWSKSGQHVTLTSFVA